MISKKVSTILGSLTLSLTMVSTLQAELTIIPGNDLAVFEPQQNVSFQLYDTNGAEGTVNFKIIDYDTQVTRQGSIELKKDGAAITEKALPNGYYDLNVELKSPSGTQKKSYPFAVIPSVDNNRPDWNKNQFGAMVLPHIAYPMSERELDARYMNRIGMRFVRSQRFSHVQVQPQQPADLNEPFNWSTQDQEVAIYQKYKLDIIANVAGELQQWMSDGDGTKLNSQNKMFPKTEYLPLVKRYYQEMAERYAGKIAYYEIGNEVDAALFWMGRAEHAAQGNKKAIFNDFIDYFVLVAQALRAGDPNIKAGPNTTGFAPDGHTYKNWLENFLKDPRANQEMDFFSSHYLVDLVKIREIMTKYGKADNDIILTELGGMVTGVSPNPPWEELCNNLRLSYIQFGQETVTGGKGLCKFLLRDLPENHFQNWVAGLLTVDFKLRPEYVGMATMIRMIAFADPVKELNLTYNTDRGWLQVYEYLQGQTPVNMIILNDAKDAIVTFKTDEKSVLVTDAMGRESTIKTENGEIALKISQRLPIFITGKLIENPGPVLHPQPEMISHVTLKGEDMSFELPAGKDGEIPSWKVITNEMTSSNEKVPGFSITLDTKEVASGKQSVKFDAQEKTRWYSLMYQLPKDVIPKIKPGEYLEITVKFKQKGENIQGIGTCVALSYRDKDMNRLNWDDSNFDWGTFDWEEKTLNVTTKVYPLYTENVTLEFYLGEATGTYWIDDVSVDLKLWKTSGDDANYLN